MKLFEPLRETMVLMENVTHSLLISPMAAVKKL